MPSPVGHALGGLIVWLVLPPSDPDATDEAAVAGRGGHLATTAGWQGLALVMGSAVAPDLDFLWGRHNMETHSLGAALLAGLAVLAWTRGRDRRLALAVALAWASHVLFDWLGSDTTPPLGVMALWPFSPTFFFADAFVFEAISRRTWLPNFWSHNLLAVVREVVLLAPPAALAAWYRRRRAG